MAERKSKGRGASASDAKPEKKSRLKGEDRRRQLIRAATQVFSLHGFRGTTMRRLAAEAGVSEAMFYHHFPSKEVLYDAILEEKINSAKQLFYPVDATRAKRDREVLDTIVGNILSESANDVSFMRMIIFGALEGNELSQRFTEKHMQEFYRFLGSFLDERMRDGAMRTMDGRIAAQLLVGMAHMTALYREVYKDPVMRETDVQALKDIIVNLFLHGVGAEGGKDVPGIPG